jgi:hypothetical protein
MQRAHEASEEVMAAAQHASTRAVGRAEGASKHAIQQAASAAGSKVDRMGRLKKWADFAVVAGLFVLSMVGLRAMS